MTDTTGDWMTEPDYTGYTFEELHDVARRINRSEFPERYARIEEEIARRYRLRDELPPPSGRRPARGEPGPVSSKALPPENSGAPVRRRSGELVIRMIAGVEIAIGCIDILRLLIGGSNPLLANVMVSVTAIAAAASILAGALLWGYRRAGVMVSIMVLLLQIPFFYTRSMGLYVIDTIFSVPLRLGRLAGGGQDVGGFLGMNVLAAGTLFLIFRFGRNLDEIRHRAAPDGDDDDAAAAV
ncbi:MAG: hypothetical protein JWQ98_1220 [Chlorobi bacterium]|nr:hypothetical protein [Chlorobiota bacterium]